jgi:hypothetical protein
MKIKWLKGQTSIFVLCVLLVLVLVLLFPVSVHAVASGSWDAQVVDPDNDAMSPSLAFDPHGYPHISYYDPGDYNRDPYGSTYAYFGTGSLKYASWNGSSWCIETVDPNKGAGLPSSLAIDENGTPHVAYYYVKYDETISVNYGYSCYLKYAELTASGWKIQTIDTLNGISGCCSLSLDSYGRPHIAYQDPPTVKNESSSLKYASWDGSAWVVTVVDSEKAGFGCSLALDSYDWPHISYYSITHFGDYVGDLGPMKYASWNGSLWVIQTIGYGGPPGQTFLVLDSGDTPHIAECDSASSSRSYVSWTGAAWPSDPIGWYPDFNAYGQGYYVSLVLSSGDCPYVSYSFSKFDTVAVALGSWNGSCWVTEVIAVDTGGWQMPVPSYVTSVALDSADKPVVSYIDGGKLRITAFAPPSSVVTPKPSRSPHLPSPTPSLSESPQPAQPSVTSSVISSPTAPPVSTSPEIPEFSISWSIK